MSNAVTCKKDDKQIAVIRSILNGAKDESAASKKLTYSRQVLKLKKLIKLVQRNKKKLYQIDIETYYKYCLKVQNRKILSPTQEKYVDNFLFRYRNF